MLFLFVVKLRSWTLKPKDPQQYQISILREAHFKFFKFINPCALQALELCVQRLRGSYYVSAVDMEKVKLINSLNKTALKALKFFVCFLCAVGRS